MKCNKCSFENNNESKFCINCGNELVSNNQYIQDEATINKQKKSCKVMGIIGLVLSFFINILSLPFNIIAIVKCSKIKKQTGKNEIGYFLGITGIVLSVIIFSTQIFLGVIIHNFVKETDKIFTPTNNVTIIEILQDKNIISKNLDLIDTVTEVNTGLIPHRYTYYIYQDNSDNIIAIYYKSNTITKNNFTVIIYENLNVQENIEYIYGDTGEYGLFYIYKDGSVSETNKYFDIRNDYKSYSVIKNDLEYSVKEEN